MMPKNKAKSTAANVCGDTFSGTEDNKVAAIDEAKSQGIPGLTSAQYHQLLQILSCTNATAESPEDHITGPSSQECQGD